MAEKPQIVAQYEQRKAAGEEMFFDPVEIDEIFHYYAEEGKLECLPEIIQLAIRLFPEDVVTQTMQAEYALNMGKAEDCLALLEPIFSEDNPFFCILKAGALAKLGDLTGAIDLAEKALQQGGDPLVGYDLGVGFMNAEQYAVALRYFSKCLDAAPDDLRTILGMLYCMQNAGTPVEVLQYAEKALEIDSFCVEAWMAKGGVLADADKCDEAVECLDYALAVSPNNSDALIMKSKCLAQLDRTKEALKVALEALPLLEGEQKAYHCMMISCFYELMGRMKEARNYAWKSIEADPTNDEVVGHAAVHLADLNDPEAALAFLQALYKKGTCSMFVLSQLAELYGNFGAYDKAAEMYEKMIERTPTALLYSLLGGSYMSMHQYDRAYQVLQKAHELGYMQQTCILLSICAYEMQCTTAMEDWYYLSYVLDAPRTKKMLKGLSLVMDKEYGKKLAKKAEKRRQDAMAANLSRQATNMDDIAAEMESLERPE